MFLRLELESGAGRVVCCDPGPTLGPPHAPPSPPHRLELRDSSNSNLPLHSETDSLKNSTVDFEIGLIAEENLRKERKDKLSFSRLNSEGDMGVGNEVRKTHLWKFREAHPLPVLEEPKSYDRYMVKRVQSASFVEVPRVGMMRQSECRCTNESQGWRARSVSISSRTPNNWRSNSRVRLISDSNLRNSLLRLQSHHSSSDEDWFEEVSVDENGDDSFESSKTQTTETAEVDKIPIFQEPHDEPYQPIQSLEDISIGPVVLDCKTNVKCYKCCPFSCRRKRKLRKSKRNSVKSNSSEHKDGVENIRLEQNKCCSIL